MDTLKIEEKLDSPMVFADAQNGYFEIKGKSLPEDAVEFYTPLDKYVAEYIKNPQPKTVFNLKLEYLNTSSSKKILDIISHFEKLPSQGYEVELNWYHRDDDQDMIDEGIEFAHMTTLKVNFIAEQ
ncbi:MAG: hypothetical protein PWR03_586 [Tenuifilum sp.]|jgi:hypothetical protein|uniref:DUF1987 domain-containing protein n=1 Tax=Tenuifilum thalassicum TaxID=2590900 RepID=A0A7D3XKA0_9BACT|nr:MULTISPECIES: DUF1987 domain-containing protein [Tenuifilum]MDI3526403.1 hypothetical protein [Tenuifilum sp.]QKG79335.1 DUF1987 domain-containing protein [Tenuifilum thalassicum]